MAPEKNMPVFTFDWKGFFILIAGAVIPTFAVAMLNVMFMLLLNENLQYNFFFLLLSNAVLWLGAILAFDFFICRPETGKKLNFPMHSPDLKAYLIIFPLMFGMMLTAEFITSQIPVTGPVFGPMYEWFSLQMEMLSDDISVMIVLAVVMAPVFEEIVFRGIIQKGLINKGMKPRTAILFSAFLFGLVHFNPWQFAGALLLGIVLGWVYEKTRSLLMPILLHAFNNLGSTLIIVYTGTESFADAFSVSEYILLAIGLLMVAGFGFLLKKYSSQEAAPYNN